MDVYSHGARIGVTGSCHELRINTDPQHRSSLLIDCGLFQGAETSGAGADSEHQEIEFPIDHIKALIITHCHIDHVGRLPWLLGAGFDRPIYCTRATAHLLPFVIEDAIKVGITRNRDLIDQVIGRLESQLRPVDYDDWVDLTELVNAKGRAEAQEPDQIRIRFRQAGHILGSSFVEVERYIEPETQSEPKSVESRDAQSARTSANEKKRNSTPESSQLSNPKVERVVFSGDLGCKNTPLLPDPAPLEFADLLVIESTYGNRNHEQRETRQQRLKSVIEHCVADRGAVLIPAFSIGRTQELLYELEDIIHQCKTEALEREQTIRESKSETSGNHADSGNIDAEGIGKNGTTNRAETPAESVWKDMVVILDSPMAAQFTQQYRRMKDLWDAEAKERLAENRHPLNFERMHIVDSHTDHERLVNYLKSTADPCIVIAASGMCTGGRMVNYLQALLPDPRTDVLFVGYQAQGTPGRDIQTYGPRGGYVDLDGQRTWIKAQVYTLGGYSAHADQQELLEFIASAYEHLGDTHGTRHGVKAVQIVHGDDDAREAFAKVIQERFPEIRII